jgi:hypothetical protein
VIGPEADDAPAFHVDQPLRSRRVFDDIQRATEQRVQFDRASAEPLSVIKSRSARRISSLELGRNLRQRVR